jgi:hypothetical protein
MAFSSAFPWPRGRCWSCPLDGRGNSGVDLPNLTIQVGNLAGCYLNFDGNEPRPGFRSPTSPLPFPRHGRLPASHRRAFITAKPKTKAMSAKRHTRILCVDDPMNAKCEVRHGACCLSILATAAQWRSDMARDRAGAGARATDDSRAPRYRDCLQLCRCYEADEGPPKCSLYSPSSRLSIRRRLQIRVTRSG